MTRGFLSLFVAGAAIALPAQAMAAEERAFDVPSGSLAAALPVLSRQAGVSVSVADADLWKSRVRSVRGRMPVGEAMARMLAGTAARAVQVSGTSWRIERRPAQRVAQRSTSPPPAPAPTPTPDTVRSEQRRAGTTCGRTCGSQ